ncbi:hypothetical protein BCR42DRAFT_41903 [Absidia repens]|uniref:Uncharacterized protein n=1 Tax=Absidia repens TaxID=90262 RepID=A0A1X2IFN6_9FUNG|nr:hypothetical protein BCR42DRAFT_41903 [Absidia repens]
MSFDQPNHSPHRPALSPEDHRIGSQQQQQEQQQQQQQQQQSQDFQQSSGYHTFASSPEHWDSNNRRPSSNSQNAPSFYSSDPLYARQSSPASYSQQHNSSINSWTEGSPDRNHVLTSFTPERNSLQQPGQTSPSTSTSSYPPYDSNRNNISNEENQISPTGNGSYLEHSKASSPAMSISQLLSDSGSSSYVPPSSSVPFTATTSNNSQPVSEGQPYFESINTHQTYQQRHDYTTNTVSQNGIGNLLNSGTEDKPTNNTTDSDTDSEDIALISGQDHLLQPKNGRT